MTPAPRVRFAPAPSGNLHVGSARTALFNWLYARRHGGTFVLRIEDTDAGRSTEEAVHGVVDTLAWLGLAWDEGPVRQSERSTAYHDAAQHLLESGDAYECYCTEAELKGRNDAAMAAGRPPGYDGRCRDLSAAQRASLAAEGRPRSLRLRTPDDGTSAFDDAVRGHVAVEWALIPDFVIVRSNGAPVFFLANAVDDVAMDISHVIRGEDLLDSTHRVLALRRALGHPEPPVYAHLPMILAPDRSKLSKRHGAVGLADFRADGVLPEALANYLALLGWSFADGREMAALDEIVAEFDLDRVTHAGAVFDRQKLEWLNGEHIRALPADEFARRVRPFADDRLDGATFAAAAALAQERSTTLAAAGTAMTFLAAADGEFAIAPESLVKLQATERAGELLDAAIAHVGSCDWTVAAIDLRPAIEGLGLKPRKAMPALYAAVEGHHTGLPLFDSIHLLGRERALARLRAARSLVDG